MKPEAKENLRKRMEELNAESEEAWRERERERVDGLKKLPRNRLTIRRYGNKPYVKPKQSDVNSGRNG